MKTTDVGKEMEVKKNVARHGARARQLTRVEEVRRKKLGGYQNMQKLDTRKSPKKATWRIDVGKGEIILGTLSLLSFVQNTAY